MELPLILALRLSGRLAAARARAELAVGRSNDERKRKASRATARAKAHAVAAQRLAGRFPRLAAAAVAAARATAAAAAAAAAAAPPVAAEQEAPATVERATEAISAFPIEGWESPAAVGLGGDVFGARACAALALVALHDFDEEGKSGNGGGGGGSGSTRGATHVTASSLIAHAEALAPWDGVTRRLASEVRMVRPKKASHFYHLQHMRACTLEMGSVRRDNHPGLCLSLFFFNRLLFFFSLSLPTEGARGSPRPQRVARLSACCRRRRT